MPSRPVVVGIVLFWAATAGLVLYRDLWPRLAASGPPPIAVELADEATAQGIGSGWAVLHNGNRVGRLLTKTTYQDADDTFRFGYKYSKVTFDVPGGQVEFPDVTVSTKVTRSGELREQAMAGRMVVRLARRGKDGQTVYDTLGEAEATVEGRVEGGVFVGRCDIKSPVFNAKRDLTPVPVPEGQVLGPLQPVNRLANVRPGQRWTVREVDPLGQALAVLFREQLGRQGFELPEEKREPLIARVGDEPEPPPGGGDPCWVIEYREGDEVRARTWVRVADGKVLRQEAFRAGETVALVREE